MLLHFKNHQVFLTHLLICVQQINLLVLYITQREVLHGAKGSQFTVLCSQEPRHVGLSSQLPAHNSLSASPTQRKQHIVLKCCFHLLPNATTPRMPTRKPQTLNIIIQQFFLKVSLNAIWRLNSFLTSNELRTSHVCLLISTQLSQRASMLAQHSQ